jgi:hypothetical protein
MEEYIRIRQIRKTGLNLACILQGFDTVKIYYFDQVNTEKILPKRIPPEINTSKSTLILMAKPVNRMMVVFFARSKHC